MTLAVTATLTAVSAPGQTATVQDTYADATKIASQTGSEVAGDNLIHTDATGESMLDFSGSSQYVSIADHNDFSFGNGVADSAFSVTAWINMDDATNFWIFTKDDYDGGSGSHREYSFKVQATDLLDFLVYDQSAAAYIGRQFSTALTAYQGQWIHVAATYSGSSAVSGIKLYLNGVRVDTTNTGTGTYVAMENKNAEVQMGARSTSSNYANGRMRDLRLFNSELSSDNVMSLYQTGENPSNPLGWWKMDEGANATATDSGSGAHNGDLTGHSPTWTTTPSLYSLRSRATSTELLSGLGSTVVNSFKYTTAKKPGGAEARLQFSSDNTTWKNANGDLVTNAGGYGFDGSDDVITVAQTIDTLMSNALGTMAVWARPYGPGNVEGSVSPWRVDGIIADTGGYVGIFWGTTTAGTGFHFYNWDGEEDTILFPVTSASYGQWFHLAWKHTGNVLYAYVNGELVGSLASGNTSIVTGTIRIGANWVNANGNDFFPGVIDDVRIYDIGLSDAEIWDLYSRHKESYDSTTGQELWLKLDGDAEDSSGNNYDGSISGATSVTNFYELPAFGEITTDDVDTLSFDGVNDVVTVPHDVVFNTGTGTSFTWTAWIKPQNQSQNSYIIGKRQTVNPYNFLLIGVGSIAAGSGTSSKKLRFLLNSDASNRIYAYTSNDVVDGKWHHVAFQRTGATTIAIYVDGVSVPVTYDAQVGNANVSNTYDLVMGSLDSSGTLPYSGYISNVAFYSTALSASQILTDFKNGYPSTTNLVAHWPLNEGAGTAVDNAEGTATYDGTINGATWTKSSTRPLPAAGTQQTIDISGLGYTNAFYYREYLQTLQNTPDRAYAQADITVDYTGTTSQVKKLNGVAQASIKKINSVPIANVKKVSGVSNT